MLQSHSRLVRKLQEALGDRLCVALDDPSVVEIMLNPDGRVFIERLGQGIAPAGEMAATAAETIIGSVAHALQSEADDGRPIISGELPIGGHRFEGLLPPVVASPTFTIRRRASRLIPLDDYIADKVMTEAQTNRKAKAADPMAYCVFQKHQHLGRDFEFSPIEWQLAQKALARDRIDGDIALQQIGGYPRIRVGRAHERSVKITDHRRSKVVGYEIDAIDRLYEMERFRHRARLCKAFLNVGKIGERSCQYPLPALRPDNPPQRSNDQPNEFGGDTELQGIVL